MLPTMKDEFAKDKSNSKKFKGYEIQQTDYNSNNPKVECSCGIRVPMDMMTDMRQVPDHLKYENCPDFICDGCKEKLHRVGIITYAELASYVSDDLDLVNQLNDIDNAYLIKKNSQQQLVKVGKKKV